MDKPRLQIYYCLIDADTELRMLSGGLAVVTHTGYHPQIWNMGTGDVTTLAPAFGGGHLSLAWH